MPRKPQAPPPGVVRNGTAEATPGRWFDVNLIRWRSGQMQPIGGFASLPGSGTTALPRDVITWHDNANIRWAAIGTDDALYAYRFDTRDLYDITPAGIGPLDPPGPLVGYGMGDYGTDTYGTARDPDDIGPSDIASNLGDRWSLDTFGEILLIVPTQDGHLFEWSPLTPTTPAAVVAEAPVENRGVIVTDQRHVVLLGAGGDPRNIAWSEQENFHIWTPSLTNLAGDRRLQTQSFAMTAVKVSQGILIYTTNDLHMMRYVGPPYAYGIDQIASGCGPCSLRAPVAIGSSVIWPGQQSFWQWAGNVTPVPCSVGDWFFSLINRGFIGRLFGSPNPGFGEMWWDWPDEGSTECNRYLALNYADAGKPWTIGQRQRTAGDPTGTMDYPCLGGPLGAGGSLFFHEFGWTADGVPRAPNGLIYAESGAIVEGEGDQRFHVRQLVIDAASPVERMIGYRFFYREQPQAEERDTGLYTEIHNGLMDVRFSGRTAQMRMEALQDGDFAIGRPRLVTRTGGSR